MYIKRYSVAAFALIGLVGWYIYAFVTHDSTSLELYGIHLPSLPIATWIIVPLALLYIVSVIHMAFYSFLGALKLRKYEKDYSKMSNAIVDAYLGKENRENVYKTKRYQSLGYLIDNTLLFPNQNLLPNTDDAKINNVIKLIDNIKRGEVVELKQYNLSKTNQLVLQNERNKYKKGNITAEEILANQSNYDESLLKEVYLDFVEVATVVNIEKYKSFLDKKGLFKIVKRINAGEFTIEISNDSLMGLFKMVELDSKDYLSISSIISQNMIPEQRMKLFEILSEDRDEVMEAYLYTLLDLELVDIADEIFENSQPDEYLNFKAYRALKDTNKTFNINLFI